MRGIGLGHCGRGDEVQIFGIRRCAARPIIGPVQGQRAVDDHRLDMGDARAVIDPDRHPGARQRIDAAVAAARCRLVGDQLDLDAAPVRAQQRLDNPGPGGQAVGADQDLASARSIARTAKAAQSLSGAKHISIVADGARPSTKPQLPSATTRKSRGGPE